MIEAWGSGISRITSACEAARNPRPEWKIEPGGGLRLEFRYSAAYQEADGVIRETATWAQPESAQPESRPESEPPEPPPNSVEAKLLALLAERVMAKAELSQKLGQKQVSGQLNKVVRRLVTNRMIEYTLPDRPRSRLQKYRLTAKGRAAAAPSPRRK